MRRADKEITDAGEIRAVLENAEIMRLAMRGDEYPYIVPLNFVLLEGALYFHAAAKGYKLECLRKDPNVCFEVDESGGLKQEGDDPCKWGMRFESVIGFGRAVFVTDPDEKHTALNAIIRRYAGALPAMSEAAVEATAVVRIDIAGMTGKRST